MSKRLNIQETVGVELNPETITNLTQLQESASASKTLPDKIITVVEGIHSGLTKNYTFYPAQNLEKSVDSWTRPYNKPVIKNHNVYEEPVGRVIAAEFKESQISSDKHTIQLTLEITDPETIKKVLDGRYQTLSIGGSTNSAVCSVCGKDLVKENYCGHMKGRVYDGKKAHWIIGEMEFDEISWVNVPADANAQVIHKNVDSNNKTQESVQEGGEKMPANVEEHTQDLLDQIDALRTAESEDTTPETQVDPAQQTEEENKDKTPEQQQEGEQKPEGEATPTFEEQIAALNDRIATLESEKATLETEKTTLEENVQTLLTSNAVKDSRVAELESEIQVADSENKSLMKQNVGLATMVHQTLAESVAQLHIVLGKTKEDEVEGLRESLTKESARSLKEKANELVKEKPQRIVQTITLADAGDIAESASGAKKEEEKEITIVDLAERLSKVFNKVNNN